MKSALSTLTLNSQLFRDFMATAVLCCALGSVEEGKRSYSFLALHPHVPILSGIAAAGLKFGLALLGTWMGCENSWSASWGVLCSCKHAGILGGSLISYPFWN